jgi:hypothetical protein
MRQTTCAPAWSRSLLVASLLLTTGCATIWRGPTPADHVLDLNREALDTFESGDFAQAKQLLAQAAATAKSAGLDRDPAMARTYINLGAVSLSENDRRDAMRYFGYALRIQPDIQPSPDIATPPVKRAFALARSQVRRRRGAASAAALSLKFPATAPAPAASAPPAAERTLAESQSGAATKVVAEASPATPTGAPAAEETALSPDDAEPDLPANVNRPLFCLAPDEAPPAVELPLRCVPRQGLAVAKMVLFYRAPGKESFTAIPMSRSHKGWYQGVVPSSVTTGKSLQYYVEVRGAGNRLATSNGLPDSPNLVMIRAGADNPDARLGSPPRDDEEEENPLALINEEHARQLEERAHRRSRHAVWLGAAVGSGYGWHPDHRLEFHDDNQVSGGLSPAGLGQVTAEIGMQYGPSYAFSLQGRLQLIPESGAGDARPGNPAHNAVAIFARAYRFFGRGSGQPFLTGTVGAGDGFRLVVPPHPEIGVGRNDTIRGGPLVLGPGAGYLYQFTSHFAWSVELRGLVGFPSVAALAELSTGAQVAF